MESIILTVSPDKCSLETILNDLFSIGHQY